MADIGRFRSFFFYFELHFFLNGGTSQISALAETKYRCYTKPFRTLFEDWPLLYSNMADPIWSIFEIFGHFFDF